MSKEIGKLVPRVLFLTANASLADGISRHILNVCSYLVRQKQAVEVAVCITHPYGDLSRELERHGIKVYHLNVPHGHDFRIFLRFKCVLADFKPTLLHIHIHSLFVMYSIGLFGKGIPVVTTYHGCHDPQPVPSTMVEKVKGGLAVARGRILAFVSKCMGAVNRAYYIYISTLTKEKREVKGVPGEILFNPIQVHATDLVAIRQHRREKRSRIIKTLQDEYGYRGKTDVRMVGIVGRLDKVKDLPSFLKVCNHIHEKMQDVLFVIVGCGPDEELRESEDAGKLGTNLIWTGYRTDARDFISAFDVLLMTSQREGMPTVVLEAMSLGTLVCSFPVPGGMEDIDRLSKDRGIQTCVFVGHRDCVEMGDKVCEMLTGDVEKNCKPYREGAIALLKECFSVDIIGNRLIEIYRNVSAEVL